MALSTCHAGHVWSRINDSKLSSVCTRGQSTCHVIIFQNSSLYSQPLSGMNLVCPKTTPPLWDHSGNVNSLKRIREGPQRHGQWRIALSNSADPPTGMNGARIGNGGIRTVALTDLEKADSIIDEDMDGKFPARVADGPDTFKSKEISTKASANTDTGDRVTMSAESGEGSNQLSNLSSVPLSSRNGNLQDNVIERGKELSEAEEDNIVALVWEAGSEIEKVTPEMAALGNRNNTEDRKVTSTSEEQLHRQEEPPLGVKISRQVSSVGTEWLNRQPATERPIWIPREDNDVYKFFGNLGKIQQKIWLMMVVYGKLAWIRLQQLLARKLRALEGILANFPQSESELNAREVELLAFSDKLMNQSAQHEEAYRRSQEALHVREGMVFQLNTRVRQLKEDVASRDALLRLLQKEASVSSGSLQRAAQSLSDAEGRIINLEKRLQAGEESLWEERDKLTAAVKSAASLQEAARVAESKVAELIAEISSLKALAVSGRRAESLSAQVKALEQELKSRDSLLLEIKAETKRSTEALTVATQIKQDLNTARQREVQLTQALENANNMVKELQTEVLENLRSLRAEQALKQMEKMLRDANLEVQNLRKGVAERDKSIYLMKDEVDLNIGLLNNAAQNREELHKMKLQVEDLKAELGSKDNKLTIMREEMASVINLARQKENSFSGTSSSDHTSFSAARSNPDVKVSERKKKLQPKKQADSRRNSQSYTQCS